MKITITKVLKAHAPYEGVSKKSGKQYKLFAYDCKGTISGEPTDFFTVKTMSEETANKLQAGGEFDADAQTFKDETSYMVKGAFTSTPTGGFKNGYKNYTPRVYLSAKQFHDMAKWIKGIADELYPQASIQAFDKLLGCASVLLDLSKYAQPKQPQAATPIKTATTSDAQPVNPTDDPHANATDEYDAGIPQADVPF